MSFFGRLTMLKSCKYLMNSYKFPTCLIKNEIPVYVSSSQFLRHQQHAVNYNQNNFEENIKSQFSFLTHLLGTHRKIHISTIKSLVSSIEKTQTIVHTTQSLMLLRLCNLENCTEPFQRKIDLVNRIWKVFNENKQPLDISHCNALLSVYIDCEHEFCPREFLEMLQTMNLKPNVITYNRLLMRYCLAGDLESVSSMLQEMRDENFSIGDYIYNALIIGHSRSNDLKGAQEILHRMKEDGLQPGSSTYVSLLRAYAEHGDVEGLGEVFEMMKKDLGILNIPIVVSNFDLLQLVCSIGEHKGNNVEEVTKKILNEINVEQSIYYNITLTAQRLLHMGQTNMALQVAKLIPSGEAHINYINKIPEELVKCEMDQFIVLNVVNELYKSGSCPLAYELALNSANDLEDESLSMALLNKMKELDIVIKPHYVYPILCKATKQGVLGVRSTLVNMDKMFKGNSSYHILTPEFMGILLPLLDASTDVNKLVNIFRELRCTRNVRGAEAFGDCLTRNNVELHKIVKFYNDIGVTFPLRYFDNLSSYFLESTKPSMTAKVLLQYNGNDKVDGDRLNIIIKSFYTNIITRLKETKQLDEKFLPLVQNLTEVGVIYDSETHTHIKTLLGEEASPELNEAVELLMASAAYTHVENMIAEGKIDEAFTEVKNGELKVSSAMLVRILEHFLRNGMLTEAREALKVVSDTKSFVDYNYVVQLAKAFGANGQIDEAITVLEENPCQQTYSWLHRDINNRFWNLVKTVDWQDRIEDLHDAIVKTKCLAFSKPAMIMIDALMEKGDVDGALKFLDGTNHFAMKQKRLSMLKQLVDKQDAEGLRKMMAICEKQLGSVVSILELVEVFLEQGKLVQAEQLMKSCDEVSRGIGVNAFVDRLVKTGQLQVLLHFMQISKSINQISRVHCYNRLLTAFVYSGNVDGALKTWTTIQEEGLQPSPIFLQRLGQFLQARNVEVPFIMPTRNVDVEPRAVPQSWDELVSRVESDRNVNVIQDLCQLTYQEEYTSLPHVFKILGLLAMRGQVQELNKLKGINFTHVSNEQLYFYLAIAHMKSDRVIEFVKNQFTYPKKHSQSFLVAIFNDRPDLLPLLTENLDGPRMQILQWDYQLSTGNIDGAMETYEKHLKTLNVLHPKGVCIEASVKKDSEILDKVKQFFDNLEKPINDDVYFNRAQLDILVSNNEMEKAKEFYLTLNPAMRHLFIGGENRKKFNNYLKEHQEPMKIDVKTDYWLDLLRDYRSSKTVETEETN